MKRILFFAPLIFTTFFISCSDDDSTDSQNESNTVSRTAIPDAAFEAALIELGIDDELDGFVDDSRIEGVDQLVLNNKGISDFSGLENFPNLYNFWANGNSLTSLDVSKNTELQFVYFEGNSVSSIDLSTLSKLEKVGASGNNLRTIDTGNNPNLQVLEITGNAISSLDVSQNPILNILLAADNPLNCIQVNEVQLGSIPARWEKEVEVEYAINCN